MNDADDNSAGRRGNYALVRRVVLFFEFDSKESQSIANPSADCGCILSDTTGEHQCLNSTQRRRECTNPLLDLVTEQRNRFSRPHVLRLVL